MLASSAATDDSSVRARQVVLGLRYHALLQQGCVAIQFRPRVFRLCLVPGDIRLGQLQLRLCLGEVGVRLFEGHLVRPRVYGEEFLTFLHNAAFLEPYADELP